MLSEGVSGKLQRTTQFQATAKLQFTELLTTGMINHWPAKKSGLLK